MVNAVCDTGVVNIYDAAPCLRHTPRIALEFPRLFWHGEELSRKLSCAENGPVLDEIRRILVHRQDIQTGVVNNVIYDTGVVNKPKKGVIYDTGVANNLFTTPRYVHDTDPGSARRCHGRFGVL